MTEHGKRLMHIEKVFADLEIPTHRGVWYPADSKTQLKLNEILKYIKHNDKGRWEFNKTIRLIYGKTHWAVFETMLTDLEHIINQRTLDIKAPQMLSRMISEIHRIVPNDVKKLNGFFVVFDGCDGVGKDYLLSSLELKDKDVLHVHEPGGTDIGQEIRTVLLNKEHYGQMDIKTEMLLYNASRAQLVESKIRPALQAGVTVIANRYYYASAIYQQLRGVNKTDLANCIRYAIGGVHPNLVFSCVASDTTLKKRIGDRERDRLEMESHEFFIRVNNEYRNLHKNEIVQRLHKGIKVVCLDTESVTALKVSEIIDEHSELHYSGY